MTGKPDARVNWQGRLRFDPAKRYPYLDYYFVKVIAKGGKPAYQVMDVVRSVGPD